MNSGRAVVCVVGALMLDGISFASVYWSYKLSEGVVAAGPAEPGAR